MDGIAGAILQFYALIWVLVYVSIATTAGLWLLFLISLLVKTDPR